MHQNPPPLPGDQPGARRSRRSGGPLLIVLSVVVAVAAAVVAWLLWSGGDTDDTAGADTGTDAGTDASPVPLTIRPVDHASSGPCPSGGGGAPSVSSPQVCYHLRAGTGLTVHRVARAAADRGPAGSWQVDIALDRPDARRFAHLTRAHRGEKLALLVNRKVLTAPQVNEPITGGKLQISGDFTRYQALNLAIQLDP